LTQAPLLFLGRFLLISTALSLLWGMASALYFSILLPPVNGLLALEGLPLRLELRGSLLMLVFRTLDGRMHYLLFSGHELVHLHAVAAVALFAATPHLGASRKVGWIAALVVAFWALQVLTLYAGTFAALGQYWDRLPAPGQQALLHTGWSAPPGNAWIEGRVFGWWNAWGGPALALGAWIVAVQPYVLSEGENASSQE
jgi:hypothetical protein